MRIICALFLILASFTADAQLDSLLKSLIISECDSNNIEPLSQKMADILPNKTVYLKGEIHSISSNGKSFRSLFIGLHERKAVNYILAEYNHSYFFSYNLFLKTGDLKILAELHNKLDLDSLSLKEYFYNIISLYNYNRKQLPENKISFVGIDVELQNAWQRNETQDNYKLAIKNFKKYSLHPIPKDILDLFDKISAESDYKILKDLDARLKEVSDMHVPELKYCFGEFYKDYYIITNSIKVLPGIFREKQLLSNFKLAIEAIKNSNPNIKPKFFGSFGSSHVHPGSNNSFGAMLNRTKQYKNQVAFIASAYYNSLSTYYKLKPIIWQGASLAGLNKAEQNEANALVFSMVESEKKPIILLSGFGKLPKGRLDFLKSYDALLIFNGF